MKEKKSHKRTLIGVAGLKSSISLGALLALYVFLVCLWLLTLVMISSPAIMIFAGILHIQAITAIRIFLAVLVCSAGVELLYLTLRLSHHIVQLTKQYLRFNKKMLYR